MKKFVVMLLAFGMLMLGGCDTATTQGDGSSEGEPNEGNLQNAVEEQVLVDDENMKVSFIKLYEEPSVPGTGYLQLKVENKTDKTVTVLPMDTYVNDTSTLLGSAVNMTLAPGKNSQTPFIIFYKPLGITSKDEIEKIEFRITFDETGNGVIAETETLIIDFTK